MDGLKAAAGHHARTHAASLIVGGALILFNGWIGIVITVAAICVGAYLNRRE